MSTVLAQAQIILTADTARFTQEITNARNLSVNSFGDIRKSAQEIAKIILTADTARFTQEITNARNLSVNSFDDIKKSAQEIAKISLIGVVAGATAGATALAAMTVEQVKLGAELAKTAQLANTSITNIQKYTFAAKAAGIEQDKLGDIFKDVQDKVGDFLNTGGGELQDFMKNVGTQAGLTADKLRHMSGPDALQAMYNAIEKANIAMPEQVNYLEAMGDEASLLIPYLRNGGEGFKLWEDAAENAGAVMDEKTLRATQELKTSTDLLDLSYRGVKNQISAAFMPVLSDLATDLVKDATLKHEARKAGDMLAVGFKFMAKTGLGAVAAFDMMGTALGGLLAMVGQLGNGVDWNSPYAFFQVAKNFWENNKAAVQVGVNVLDDLSKKMDSYANKMAYIDKLGTSSGSKDGLVDYLTNLRLEQEKIQASLGKTGKQLKEEAEAKEKNAKATEKQANALQKLGDTQLAVYSAWKKNGISDQWAKILTAEVGRENDYNAKNLFGFHKDAANGQINIGMLSWQKERGKQLASYLASQGLLVNGKIVQSQASLDAMAKFAINEIMTNPAYARTKNALLNSPNIDTNTGFAITGDNFIKWDRSGHAKLGAGAAKHAAKRDAYYRQISARSGLADGSNSFKDSQQQIQEIDRIKKEQDDLEKKFKGDYGNEATKAYIEHLNKIEEITKLKNENLQKDYLAKENARYLNKLDLLELEFDKQTQKANEWQQTEEERIKNNAELERRETRLTVGLHQDLVTARINEINAKEQAALQQARKGFEDELASINSYKTSAVDKIRADFQAKILANDHRTDIGPEQIATLREAMTGQMNNEIDIARKSVADPYNNMMAEFNGTSELQNLKNQLDQRLEIIKAYEKEHTKVADEAARARKLINDDFANHQKAVLVGGYQQAFGTMASIVSTFGGQQSRAYHVLANIEKGYALHKAWLNSKSAILDAYSSTTGSIWAKAAAAAKAAMDTGFMTAAISAIQPKGFMDGGYTGNIPTNARAGYVHGQEYVFDAPSTKAIGVKNLDRIRKGEGIGGNTNINVNVTVNSDGTSSIESQQQLGKNIGDAIRAAVQQEIRKEQRQGGSMYGRR